MHHVAVFNCIVSTLQGQPREGIWDEVLLARLVADLKVICRQAFSPANKLALLPDALGLGRTPEYLLECSLIRVQLEMAS